MTSQMNLVHNAARLAMADHRAATTRRPRARRSGIAAKAMLAIGLLLAALISFFSQVSEPG